MVNLGKKLQTENAGARAPVLGSASDQAIMLTRAFGENVQIKFLGEDWLVRPPSYFVHNLVADFKKSKAHNLQSLLAIFNDGYKDHIKKDVINQEFIDKLFSFDKTQQVDIFEYLINNYGKLLDVHDEERDRILYFFNDRRDDAAMELVQFILFEGRNATWRKDAETWPKPEELEEVMPMKRLKREPSFHDLGGILKLYDELDDPEIVRKNFSRLREEEKKTKEEKKS